MKPLKHENVKLLIVHCVANKCNRPFDVENLKACGEAKYGQCSYHYYVRRNGDVIPMLSESVQGVHARHYNYCRNSPQSTPLPASSATASSPA